MKCSRCEYEFSDDDFAPGFDAFSGALICEDCKRKQRHAKANPRFEDIRMAEVQNAEVWE